MENITLHDCRIPKRGRGAKGSVEVQTLGKPISDKETGIAKDFDYDGIETLSTSELMAFLKKQGFSVNLCLARGFDALAKSASIRAQSAQSIWQTEILKRNLAESLDEAKKVALAFGSMIAKMKESAELGLIDSDAIPTFEKLCEARKAKLIKDGKYSEPEAEDGNQEENETEDED